MLAGMPKFGYCNDVFTMPPDWDTLKLKRKIYTTKENGEAGHLAFFRHCGIGKWYAIIGSKNVHIVASVASEEEFLADLEVYKTKGVRYDYALANAKLLFDCQRDILFAEMGVREILYEQQLTIIFEAIYNNHIVDYDREKVIAFGITKPQFDSVEEQGLCMPTEIALGLLALWGFTIPEYDIADASDTDKIAELDEKYEKMDNSEGAVVYEEYEGIGKGEDRGVFERGMGIIAKIYKHKNHVYIVRRMARELIKRLAIYSAWLKRFADIHFDANYLSDEIQDLLAFYVWLIKKNPTYKDREQWADRIHENFKELLKEFRNEMKKLSPAAIKDLVDIAPQVLICLASDSNDQDYAIMLVGNQGSGKTTLRNMLHAVLGKEKSAYINQDELNGKRKAFIAELKNHKKNKGKILIVDKCNHLTRLREDVYNVYSKVLILEFQHPDGQDAMESLSLERIKTRGIGHPSLLYSTHVKTILANTMDAYEGVTDIEKKTNEYISLNPLDTIETNLCKVVAYLGVPMEKTPEDAMTSVVAYEERLRMENVEKVLYWRASANVADVLAIMKKYEVPIVFPPKEEYHITLSFNKKLTKEELDAYTRSMSSGIRVQVLAIAYNDQCSALKCGALEIPCQNKIPHITLGTIDGVQPVYANEMLTTRECNYGEILLEDTYLDLIVNPVLKRK